MFVGLAFVRSLPCARNRLFWSLMTHQLVMVVPLFVPPLAVTHPPVCPCQETAAFPDQNPLNQFTPLVEPMIRPLLVPV